MTSIANAVGFVAERNGNPAGAGNTFIINTAPFNETLEKYYNYVRNNNQVIMLMHDDYQEGFLDREMAAYAYLAMPNKDPVNGNTKEEFDAITEKYFGKKIDDYNTGMTYVIPETGRIAPTGWDYSRIYMVLKELSEDTNGIGTGIFYTIYIHPGDESPEKNDLLSGKFETYLYREYGGIYLVEMQFKEKYDENGEMYFEYLSINYTGETVGSYEKITPYGSEQELEKSIPDPIQHEQLETFRFPTSEKHTAVEELTEKELIKYSNQYFYKNDAAVSLLANKIHPFISYDNSLLEDFEGINNINCDLAQYAAYRLSPRIYVTTDYGEYIDYLKKYPDHIISKLIYEKKSKNINIDDLRYIDDIKENLVYLFGDENKQLLNIENDIVIDGLKYKCAINAGVVYLEGTVTYNSGTPQITSYKKTESGYICEAIILPAYDIIYYEGKSIKVDNQSAVMAYAHLLPKYRFEFKEADDGRLILYSQKTLYLP